jgi:predicted lipid-binding transport protein (Tim44 family)
MNRYKNFFLALVALAFTIGLTVTDAQAARLGGGKSFGMTRSTPRQSAPPAAPAQNAVPSNATTSAPAPAAAAKPGMSRWLGPLAGLAAGVGLAALLSHFGMGEGVANFMMIALLVMAAVFLFRWLMRKREPELSTQYAGGGQTASAPVRFDTPVASPLPSSPVGAGDTPSNQTSSAANNIPADFDVAGFVRQAKLNFVRLQAANDRGDLDDIRQFTAPEVFAEIQMQLQERGNVKSQTDVVQLNAELLSVVTEDGRQIASVRYFGQLREDTNGAPQAFEEIWHLTKPTDGSRGWQIAGIQQIA